MGFKSAIVKPLAHLVARNIDQWSARAAEAQERIFHELVREARHTVFGRDHGFDAIKSYEDFTARVPIRDYEGLKPYVEQIKAGKSDVLWKGRPRYFAKTSGTTSGVKYIPITNESMPNHMNTARNALFLNYARTGKGSWVDGRVIFLSGSPVLEKVGGIPTGRLSGIVNHEIPFWLKSNQLPSFETNCIEDWEEKLDRIIDETVGKDLRLISGIPPWVQMYYERLLERTGKQTVKEVFPNFSVFVYGGVNYQPYRAKLEELTGGAVATIETYPASEGFIAFQDVQGERGLLLNADSGLFFEFVPADEIFNENPSRLRLHEVKTGVNYALIINSNAGLWGYDIGDTVEFVSTNPYRIIVSGRVKHFISAFGEHVIGKEVEAAMQKVSAEMGVRVVEFTVAPQVNPPEGGTPYHEWWVEFDEEPGDIVAFAGRLNEEMCRENIYYEDLISGKILQGLKIRSLKRDAFREYMKSLGKLGGQNKVPRLSNDRKIADQLAAFMRQG